MNNALFEVFLTEDCDAHVRHRLGEAVRQQGETCGKVCQKFTFNRFNVTLDFQAQLVTLEDDLNIDADGKCHISMAEFLKRVGVPL